MTAVNLFFIVHCGMFCIDLFAAGCINDVEYKLLWDIYAKYIWRFGEVI